ncbi:MAG: hypothetical protein Phog2KO_42600 [Phototrophicaceae bacterium]
MKKIVLITIIFILSACTQQDSTPQVLPTLAEPDAIATGFVLTENAPPAGFETVSFPSIDANLELLSGWRYQMFFSFNGVFARTPRQTSASTQAVVTYNQVASARRVEAVIDVDLEDQTEPILFEGVRQGPNTFLLRDGQCASNTDQSTLLADLSAGNLLGGVHLATNAFRKEQINGQEVWLYNFLADDLILPNVRVGEEGRILSVIGEVWVAPEYNVIIRYNVTMEVENALIFDQELPISGTISLQYDLSEIGVVPNISIPNGC